MSAEAIWASGADGALLLNIKAVPGAKRNEIAGRLGARLKVRVSQPPEDGKANRAICQLVARELGVKAARVSVQSGLTIAEKTLRIAAEHEGQPGGKDAGATGMQGIVRLIEERWP